MSSTNKTTNYELSQFLGTDKPAWLTDYNSDMSKIDAGVHTAQTTATGADGKADANATAIGTLASLTTEAKTSVVAAINEVDSHADTAQNTATNAATTANTASNKADNALTQVANFNLTTFSNLTGTISNGVLDTYNFTCAKNADGSLAKIYGSAYITGLTATTTITLSDTGLRPEEAITFSGCAISERFDTNGGTSVYPLSYTLNTNGTVTIQTYGGGVTTRSYVMLFANLLFVKDFGDVPVNPQ